MTGDITAVTIGTIRGTGTVSDLFKIIAGAGWLVDAIRVDGVITGWTTGEYGIYLGDDPANAGTIGGTYGDIDLGVVDCTSNNGTGFNQLLTVGANADKIKGTFRHIPSAGNTWGPVVCQASNAANTVINHLILSGMDQSPSTYFVAFQTATYGVTVNHLIFDALEVYNAASNWAALSVNGTVTVNEVIFRACDMTFPDQTQYAVEVVAGTVSRIVFREGRYVNGGNMALSFASAVMTLILDRCVISSFVRIAHFYGNTTVILLSPEVDSMATYEMFSIQGATLLVEGSWTGSATAALVFRVGGTEAVQVNSPQLKEDLSILTPAEGDLCYNSNGALSCGTGVAIHHTGGTGNGWKNLYSGSTY